MSATRGERRVDVGGLFVALPVESSRVRRPVVHAVNVHAGREHIGVPRQGQRGQVAPVGAAVNPDAARIDARLRPEISRCRLNVSVSAAPRAPEFGG